MNYSLMFIVSHYPQISINTKQLICDILLNFTFYSIEKKCMKVSDVWQQLTSCRLAALSSAFGEFCVPLIAVFSC